MWETLLTAIIVALLFALISIINSAIVKRDALRDDPVKVKSKDPNLDKMISVLQNEIISKGNLYYKDYNPPENLIQNMVYTNYEQYSVQQVANNMLEFIGVPANISICMDDQNGNYQHSVAGNDFISRGYSQSGNQPRQSDNSKPGYYYTSGNNITEIHLNKKYNYGKDHILAILAHEIAHHFLYIKSFSIDNEEENEKLTDVTAVYLGFGQILLKGYKSIKWISDEMFDGESESFKVNNYKIGYLSVDDIAYVVKKVKKIRVVVQEKKQKEEMFKKEYERSKALISDLLNNISIAENLYDHNVRCLKIIEDKCPEIDNRDHLDNIMENGNEHYTGNVSQKLDSIKDAINNVKVMTPDKHDLLLSEITNLSSKIAFWNSIISKYL